MDSILFVDDERNVLRTLYRQLNAWPYDFHFAQSAEEGLAVLRNTPISVVVSDMQMPDVDGVAFLTEVKRRYPLARRVVLTGYAEMNSALKAINDASVHAYLEKPWDAEKLMEVLEREVNAYWVERDVSQEKETLATQVQRDQSELNDLRQKATTDPLTGLSNRRNMEIVLKQEWRRALRSRRNLAVMMIDIDHFKLVNDFSGHAEGDRVLALVAKCLRQTVQRPGDFVARYGGEEFIVLLPDTQALDLIGERFRAAVEALQIPHPGLGEGRVVTISVGGASHVPTPTETLQIQDLLDAADKALYRSKEEGRNRVTLSGLVPDEEEKD